MDDPPTRIGDAEVVLFATIEDRPGDSADGVRDEVAGLAICQYDGEESFYLFACDAVWDSIGDSWHETLDEAKKQAEFERPGLPLTWRARP